MSGDVSGVGLRLPVVVDRVVTHELWSRLEPLIPAPERRYRFPGRRRVDNRAALEGILFVISTGMRWNDLPTTMFGASGATCSRRLKEWYEAGVWQQLHEAVLAELRAAGLLDLAHAVVDSSHLSFPRFVGEVVTCLRSGQG